MSRKKSKNNKNKKTGIIITAIMALILVGAGIAGVISTIEQKKDPSTVEPSSTEASTVEPTTAEPTTVDPYYSGAIDVLHGETQAEPSTQEGPQGTTDPGYEPTGNEPQSEHGGNMEPSKEESTVPPQTLPVAEIFFPYEIPNTDLVVEKLSSYSGYYIEDGQDQPVSNVAAIVLTNKGSDMSFAGIGISMANSSYAFSASQIPAGATVIILEQNKISYSGAPCYSCTATTNRVEQFSTEGDRIRIVAEKDGTFTVYNFSDKTFSNVKVMFKNYLPQEDVYVGGITYTVNVSGLEPGTGVNIASGHYDQQYTRFVEIVIEE